MDINTSNMQLNGLFQIFFMKFYMMNYQKIKLSIPQVDILEFGNSKIL